MIKKYFPGGNTGIGFYNCFDYLKNTDEEEFKTFVLKGGPGVGKSTIMKNIANEAAKRGYDVTHYFCSGDPDSYDAVKIKEKKAIIVDGTAPHIIDPVFPGVDDEIVNLGAYISTEICEKRDTLKRYFAKNRYEYTRCYGHLSTAYVLSCSNKQAIGDLCNREVIDKKIRSLLGTKYGGVGYRSKMFLDAITCKGIVSFKESMRGDRIISVSGYLSGYFMDRVNVIASGYEAMLFLDPLDINTIRHIYLPEINIWFTSYSGDYEIVLEEEYYSKEEIPDFVVFNEAQCHILIQKAIAHLRQCKASHDEIENIYKDYMDFTGVNKEYERLLEIILG